MISSRGGGKLGWTASEHQGHLPPVSQVLGLQVHTTMPGFCVGAAGPHACVTSTLLNKPSPQPVNEASQF